MYYEVTLLNDSLHSDKAEIVVKADEQAVSLSTYSENSKLKSHLDWILNTQAYVLAPGKFGPNYYSEGVLLVYPGTKEFAQLLPEILSWRGYNCRLVNEVHKSAWMYEGFVYKSVEDIHYNDKGERIVKRVPQGFVAVHTDGRTVAAGGWINANIDKENADWSLVENPYETWSEADRATEKDNMDMFLQEYHPGADEAAYTMGREEGDEYHYTDYQPEEALRLTDIFDVPGELGDLVPLPVPKSGLQPGKILYSPSTGYAIMSENWPPDLPDFQRMDWFAFDNPKSSNGEYLSDKEKELYAQLTGKLIPEFISGLDQGLIQVDQGLPTDTGFRFSLPDAPNFTINEAPGRVYISPKTVETVMNSPEYRRQHQELSETMQGYQGLLNYYDEDTETLMLDPDLKKKFKFEAKKFLKGKFAKLRGKLRDYQEVMVAALVERGQYESMGGLKGWHGHFMSTFYGSGKSVSVLAADAIMRNRGDFVDGEQVTVVTAPKANTEVWKNEIAKFRGENALIIDAPSRAERIELWEGIIRQAQSGDLPPLIILASSKFGYNKSEKLDMREINTDYEYEHAADEWELAIDSQYLRLLAAGGTFRDEAVKGGHIAALVLDESGQFVNPQSRRHRAVAEIADSIYHGGGLMWTLNGDLSGNSASDTISELSQINKMVRDQRAEFESRYTKPEFTDKKKRVEKDGGRNIWRNSKLLREFADAFKAQVTSAEAEIIAGGEYGLERTDDTLAELGHTWGGIYNKLHNTMKLLKAEGMKPGKRGLLRRAFGAMNIMIQASLGAVTPSRMMDYGVGVDNLLKGTAKLLSPVDQLALREKIRQYQGEVAEIVKGVNVLMPVANMSTMERDKVYRKIFSERERAIMSKVAMSWDAPILDNIVDGVTKELQTNNKKDLKIGIAGFSKVAMHSIRYKLQDLYGSDVLIQLIDGDSTAKEIADMQDAHAATNDRPVITIVTSAGLYGLSLPADRSFRLPTWNSARGGQYEGRFHRSPKQKNLLTVASATGILSYMRSVEQKKRVQERGTRGVFRMTSGSSRLDEDDEESTALSDEAAMSFLEKLDMYAPTIRSEERGEL